MPDPLRLLTLLIAVLLPATSTMAAPDSCWSRLEYGASQGFLSADIALEFEVLDPASRAALQPGIRQQVPATEPLWLMRADFSAMRSAGEQLSWYTPDEPRLLKSQNVSQGSNRRAKLHTFDDHSVLRERREPKGASSEDPLNWTLSSRKSINYPRGIAPDEPVINATLLLLEAARMVQANEASRRRAVFTDTQLYSVELKSRGIEMLQAGFDLERAGNSLSVSGKRRVMRIGLEPTLLGKEPEDEPFSLLELSGELSILVDLEYVIPVLVEGSWYRIGTIPAALSSAQLRATDDPLCAD